MVESIKMGLGEEGEVHLSDGGQIGRRVSACVLKWTCAPAVTAYTHPCLRKEKEKNKKNNTQKKNDSFTRGTYIIITAIYLLCVHQMLMCVNERVCVFNIQCERWSSIVHLVRTMLRTSIF